MHYSYILHQNYVMINGAAVYKNNKYRFMQVYKYNYFLNRALCIQMILEYLNT